MPLSAKRNAGPGTDPSGAHPGREPGPRSIELATYRTEYRILGPLEVIHRGRAVAIRGQKKRALLARLLLEANTTVSVDALIDGLWGERVPATAVKMVHVYVSQLRKELPAGVLHTRPPGYVLEVPPEALDLLRFLRVRDEARAAVAGGDAAAGAERLVAALSLWRGRALAEFSEPFSVAEASHLEELRLAALEDRIDADLALGRHRDVVGELQALVAAHPLRERPRRQLMLALYRAGRHAEALAAHEQLRRALADELGIEPSAALGELQYRILNQDPALDLPAAPPDRPARRAPEPPGRRGRGSEHPLVGRAQELERLERAYEAAHEGHGSVALIAGPAGIGKTRLAGELAGRAREDGATVLTGRCIDMVGAALPYVPLVEALRPLRNTPALGGLGELTRILPGSGGAGAPCQGPDRHAGESQLELFEAVLAVLDRLGAHAPVVLVLEDLHWADRSTLDLFAFLAHAIQDRRILILASWRREAVQPDDVLHRLAAALHRRELALTLQLGPLAQHELEALVARGAERLPAELTEAVCARAEGNPFFAQELHAAALRGEQTLPRVLQDVLLADFGRLDEQARGVVRVAAAAGRAVPHGLLTAAVRCADHEVVAALRRAVDHGMLVPDQALGTYRFRHALLAEAAYGTLLPGEREEVHEQLALALAATPALAVSGAPAAELAEHWIAARRPAEAMVASLEAARDARAVSGLSEALRHLERVCDLWERVPHADEVACAAIATLLSWATELAGARLTTEAATTAVDRLAGGTAVERPWRSAPARLAVAEARELYPLVVVLESLAIRQSPPFGRAALEAMHSANQRMRAALEDPSGAIVADDDFHTHLTAGCGNDPLLAALRPVRRALLRYEQVYMLEPARIERSADQHDGIIEALERRDHLGAAQRLRSNLTGGLPSLTFELEG